MKKTLITIALSAVMAVASAQNESGTLSIQPKGGFGLATLTNVPKAEMTGVGMFGGELEYAFKENLSLAGGLNFNMLGFEMDDADGIKDWHTSLNYLAVPVVVNYYLYKGLALKAGLQPGLLLSANETYKEDGDKYDTKVTGDETPVSGLLCCHQASSHCAIWSISPLSQWGLHSCRFIMLLQQVCVFVASTCFHVPSSFQSFFTVS